MKITKSEFLKDVETEIKALKKSAFKIEIAKLNFKCFHPRDSESCIYGQMTGNCLSPRAVELIEKCCIRVVNTNLTSSTLENFSEARDGINGAPSDKIKIRETGEFGNYLSALETYIHFDKAKNKHIIQYLKGEVKTLKL